MNIKIRLENMMGKVFLFFIHRNLDFLYKAFRNIRKISHFVNCTTPGNNHISDEKFFTFFYAFKSKGGITLYPFLKPAFHTFEDK